VSGSLGIHGFIEILDSWKTQIDERKKEREREREEEWLGMQTK